MKSIVLYCKSYYKDLERAKNLADSVAKYNIDNIPFYISVPKKDFNLFSQRIKEPTIIVNDEDIFDGIQETEGWVVQQIIKSNFWKLNLCENYVMIDSDSYFIRPFYIKDFIVDGLDNVPYTVMHEQKDLFYWTSNKKNILGFNPIESFKECRQSIMDLFERKGRYYDFGPSPTIWSSKVWKSLEDKYLIPNNITLADAIKNIKSEFSWYGEWLLTDKTIPIFPVEPLFKVFHYSHQYIDTKNQNYTEQDLSKVYMGVVMQSNWGSPLKY